jgi:16S rRNA (cytosine967-C5)-methyltransferase
MNARDMVTSRIALQTRVFPELDLASLDVSSLDDRDATLARAIEHIVLRHWLTLARVIESQLDRPWDDIEHRLQAALLVGAAQLLYLDRLPDHAVINEAVEWTKGNVRRNAGGMANAVLRNVARVRGGVEKRFLTALSRHDLPRSDGQVMRLTEPVFDEPLMRRLAQQTSHPDSLIARWKATFGEPATAALALHDLMQAPIIVSGTKAALAASDATLVPHAQAGFHVFAGEHRQLESLLAADDQVIVHDPTSAAPILATGDLLLPPHTIIDACAGKGTKTRLLARIHPEARIITTDIDPGRQSLLENQFQGHERISVAPFNELRQFAGQADLLVLDVPCSNSGVLARRVEAKYRITSQSLQSLADVQRQIVADTILLLTTNGRLLYCTCSIDEFENQQQARWIAKWHRMHITDSHQQMPIGLPGGPAEEYRDGGYWALLSK